jgi:GTP cyclohydrolase IV
LPEFRREQPGFEMLFGRSSDAVIRSMDAAGHDIPEQRPAVQLPIGFVGLERSHVPIAIDDPFAGGVPVRLACEITGGTAVPVDRRGVHMSRIGNLLAEAASRSYPDLVAAALDIAERLRETQYDGDTRVALRGHLAFLEQLPGRGDESVGKQSLESIELIAEARLVAERTVLTSGLTIDHLTACPCVQQTFRHAQPSSYDPSGDSPSMTHSQRCRTIVLLSGSDLVPVRDLLRVLDGVIFRTCNTLPRDLELAMVYRAHREPQFVEDAARAMAAACRQLRPSRGPDDRIQIASRSMESIHGHDIVVELEV